MDSVNLEERAGVVIMAAALVVLLLLAAFHHVVAEAVRDGEARRKALAERMDEEWRCRSIATRSLRQACLAATRTASS